MKVLINFNELKRMCFDYDAVDVKTYDGTSIISEVCVKSNEACIPENCPLVFKERIRE